MIHSFATAVLHHAFIFHDSAFFSVFFLQLSLMNNMFRIAKIFSSIYMNRIHVINNF